MFFNLTALMVTCAMTEALILNPIPLLKDEGAVVPNTVREWQSISYPFQRTCALYVQSIIGAAMMLVVFRAKRVSDPVG